MVFQFETGIYDDSITFLEQLADTKIEDVQNGQAPVYDSSINKYTNQSVLTGDISGGNEGDTLVINSSGSIETNSVLRIDTVNNRVGINIPIDETIGEDFDVDGNIQIRTSGTEKITFYDNGHDHEHGKILVTDDSTGAQFQIHVKEAGVGAPVILERFTIRENGAIGFNTQYGNSGEVLTSQGGSSPPIWTPLNSKVFMSMNATDLVSNVETTVNTWVTPAVSVPSGLYVSPTDIFNPPRNGYYSINFQTTIRGETSNSAFAIIYLYKNGSLVIRSQEMEANPTNPVYKTRFLNINIIIFMTPTDTLKINVQGDNSFRMLGGSLYTNLSIHNVD